MRYLALLILVLGCGQSYAEEIELACQGRFYSGDYDSFELLADSSNSTILFKSERNGIHYYGEGHSYWSMSKCPRPIWRPRVSSYLIEIVTACSKKKYNRGYTHHTTVSRRTGEYETIQTHRSGERLYASGECQVLEFHDKTYSIGQIGPAGGIVFYVSDGGAHGLEAAPADLGSARWGCYGRNAWRTNGTAIGTGADNTYRIFASCTNTNSNDSPTAADLVYAYKFRGYTDWFLPSKDELNALYDARDVVGAFASVEYWSSSQYNNKDAWAQYFVDGQQYADVKANAVRVRAVRAF